MKKQKTNIKSKKLWWRQAISKDAGIFIKISRTSLLTFTLLFSGFTSISYFSNSRTLTDSEDKLLKDMGYNSSIDTKKVRIYRSAAIDSFLNIQGSLAMAIGNSVFVHGNNYTDDFAKDRPINKHIFKHEMAHVWQYQNCPLSTNIKILMDKFNMLVNRENIEDLYNYDLSSNKDLLDYGIEQQAEILANSANVQGEVLQRFKKNPLYIRDNCF